MPSGFVAPSTASLTLGTDGWTNPQETWTYASATTMTVPNGALYQKGDRIKLTQTTVKYFVVASISSNTLTITGGSDYTLANAAITSNFFSRQLSPVGYPTWFNFDCQPTGWAATPTQTYSKFKVEGASCTVTLSVTGTSNATTIGFTAPIAQASLGGGNATVWLTALDSGTLLTAPGRVFLTDNSAAITAQKDMGAGAWTATGSKVISLALPYVI